ncbi:hypothetical protein [Streptomyces sioyaensis]|uniref:hypothetical protein n=1 Tax=Streptomyces sioyaensis TaxID=67364 RepID=UPI003D74B650
MTSCVLAAMADHFTQNDPTVALTEDSFLVCVGLKAYDLTGRSLNGIGPALSRAALSMAPVRPAGITRGEYALLLRKAAVACGWSNEDNEPAIPRIPCPRDEPQAQEVCA